MNRKPHILESKKITEARNPKRYSKYVRVYGLLHSMLRNLMSLLLEWWVLNALYFLDECDFPWVHVLSWCERLWKTVTSDLCVCCFLIYLWGLSLTVAARAERRAVLTLEVSTIWKVILLKSYSEFKLYFHLINFHWYWQSIVIFPWI